MGAKQSVGPRMTAEIEGDFAVFMTGMRINNEIFPELVTTAEKSAA